MAGASLQIALNSVWNDKGVKQAESDLKKVGDSAVKASKAIGAGLVASTGLAVKAASDLGETMNATQKVFGDAAGTIQDFGKTAATEVGLSQRAFQELATTTGAVLTNLGQSQDEAAASSIELTQRAADLASVFNTSVPEALEAINAGLKGSNEPLQKYGVTINDQILKQKALELGIYDGVGALTAEAKAASAQAVIMEQSAAVAGDFTDTQDSAANATRTLAAMGEDLAAQLGEVLLPIVEQVIGQLQGLVQWMSENETTVQVLIGALAALVTIVLATNAALKAYRAIQLAVRAVTVAWTAVQWLLNAALTANPIGIIIVLIGLLIAAVVGLVIYFKDDLIPVFEALWSWINDVADSITGALGSAVDWITDKFQTLADFLSGIFDTVGGVISTVGDWLPFGIDVSAGSAPTTDSVAVRAGRAAGGAGQVVNVNVRAGIGDPAAIAQQVKRVLRNDDHRLGVAAL